VENRKNDRMRFRFLGGLVLPLAIAAGSCGGGGGSHPSPAPLTIECVGDSITEGITQGSETAAPERDPQGGYPGRLQAQLGSSVRVLNRGAGGSTVEQWLAAPASPDGQLFWSLVEASEWQGFPLAGPPAGATSSLVVVVGADRPDLVIILLGINDIAVDGPNLGAATVGVVADRLDAAVRQAESLARHVLISTLLPNQRDPAPLIDGVNAQIRSRHPDFLPLGERFAAAGGVQLLGDFVHPDEQGYSVLAGIVADELTRRGLVAAR
jgi:lysophospholipase L1-like esterase